MAKVELKYVEDFTVAGRLGQGGAEKGPQWIMPLWDQANASYAMIEGIVLKDEHGAPKGTWGLMGHPDKYLGRWDDRGLYLAGCEIEADSDVPEGWTKWTVPAHTYLVADCRDTAYGEVFNEVIGTYLPEHGLKLTGAVHEHYPEPGIPAYVELYFPIAEDRLFCQSCGMPLTNHGELGTEQGGEVNYEYCVYCYKDGAFTADVSMEEMIEQCLQYGGDSGMFADKAKAREAMLAWFPTLGRWKRD
ncbi:effector binding domain-containing protein [Paenibacillus timonensis]|uniref:Zinc ribbon domain-containing protein n=1 Tax=Paenibacillus timonensis TaxID=225915 RepID=A0ABW3SD90_9BACL|nr:zinc ribbon domain-containing protein [Paenibacillus timonensis]MCH1642297.1 effector binding domain-containing protein [Paenibacillus timonensis]